MKKYLLFIAIFISIIIPYRAYSADISIGATAWEAWVGRSHNDGTKLMSEPAFFGGPVLFIQLYKNFDISFIYLYGIFREADSGAGTYDNTVKMKDSDMLLGCKLNDYIKLLAGVKYISSKDSDVKYNAYGPNLGFSADLPITYKISFILSVTGFYLGGQRDDGIDKKGYNEYGFNSNLELAYYIAPASTEIRVGRRFQYYKSDYYSLDAWSKNLFHGTTLTATYNFSI
jgi:hypothetical protein